MSFETIFDTKQPKLEPKLVSALSETKLLFWLFRFYTETESFDVLIEPKQTEDQPKQFDREHFFGLFWNSLFRNSLFRLFRFYTKTESFYVSIEPKHTKDPHKQFKRVYIWVFFRKFRVVLVCFGLLQNSSVCFGCFDIGSKHQNKRKYFVFGFTEQTETNTKQILFQCVSVRTEIYFCLCVNTLISMCHTMPSHATHCLIPHPVYCHAPPCLVMPYPA